MFKILVDEDIFTIKQEEKYSSFKNFNTVCPKEHLKEWINTRIKTYKF